MTSMTSTTPASAPRLARIASIDALRGLVMIVMLLDHVRETFYLHLQVSDPMAVPGTPPELFFSRLAAHLCAPVFVFLTGLSAWLYANPDGAPRRDARAFLLKRGLLLVGLELTLVTFAWSGHFRVIYLQVIWAIGFSMLALALLSSLPRWLLVAIGLVIVGGHNALAGVAWVDLATGEFGTADRLLDESEAVLANAGPWFLLLTLYVRAVLEVRRGRAGCALALIRRSLTTIRELNMLATGGVFPDLTLLFDLDPAEGFRRIGRRRLDHFERQALAFHRRVRRGYLEIQRAEPKRVRTIDASRTPADVGADVRRVIDEFLRGA